MEKALIRQGLFDFEAQSMIQTWWKSYFDTKNLRVFWIVPNEVVDEVLPLKITPNPDKITRVLVGRAEIMSKKLEDSLREVFRDLSFSDNKAKGKDNLKKSMSDIDRKKNNDRIKKKYLNDRFGLAYKDFIDNYMNTNYQSE